MYPDLLHPIRAANQMHAREDQRGAQALLPADGTTEVTFQ